jgi:hypothetical protein
MEVDWGALLVVIVVEIGWWCTCIVCAWSVYSFESGLLRCCRGGLCFLRRNGFSSG